MRLDKFLSNMKYGTRTEVKKIIKDGLVSVNGKVTKEAKLSINPNEDIVQYRAETVFYKEKILIMMNKPKGYVSATKDALHKTVVDLLDEPYTRFDLNIAGRLDIDTEGLILLTNDGDMLHNLISPKKNVYKKYYVEVNNEFDCTMLLTPMKILDGANKEYEPFQPRVKQLTSDTFYLEIKEGKFHQVKRMCQYCGVKVTYLKRVVIGDIELDPSLELGEYKEIKNTQ